MLIFLPHFQFLVPNQDPLTISLGQCQRVGSSVKQELRPLFENVIGIIVFSILKPLQKGL